MGEGDWIRRTRGWDAHGVEGAIHGRRFAFTVRRARLGSDFESLACHVSMTPEEPIQNCSFGHLYAFLAENRGDPQADAALAAIGTEFLPGMLDLLSRRPEVATVHEHFYAHNWRLRSGRIALALRHPSLIDVLHSVSNEVYVGGHPPATLDAKELLTRYAPDAIPGSIRSILRMDRVLPTNQVLKALLALPPERHPRDETEIRAFETLVMASFPVADLLGGYGYLASAGNGWAAYADALARRLPDAAQAPQDTLQGCAGGLRDTIWSDIHRACLDVRDVAVAFARQVLVPQLHARSHETEADLLWLSGMGEANFPVNQAATTLAAARLLLRGKSLPAILELSADWHARRRAVDAAVDAIDEASPGPVRETSRPDAWPIPFDAVTAPNGVEVSFLGSQAELAAEGGHVDADGNPGLRHCVASYGPGCASGQSTIASVRVRRGSRIERLSTAELVVDERGVRILQHRGPGNAEPSRKACNALEWFVGEVDGGRLNSSAAYMARGWRTAGGAASISGRCGYDHLAPGAVDAAILAWSPFLTRPMRRPDALFDEGRRLVDELGPTMPGRRRQGRHPSPGLWERLYDVTCRIIVAPLAVGDYLARRAEDHLPFAKHDHLAIGLALAIEASMLWAIHAWFGHAWIAVLCAQLALPTAISLKSAVHVPGAILRTARGFLRASAANRRSAPHPSDPGSRPGVVGPA